MLKLVVLQPGGGEAAEAMQEIEIKPGPDGAFSDETYLPGVHIRNVAAEEGEAVLQVVMEKSSDCWLHGAMNGSMVNLAIQQVAAKVLQSGKTPRDLHERVVLTDFHLPLGVVDLNFAVMRRADQKWQKVSDVRLSNS